MREEKRREMKKERMSWRDDKPILRFLLSLFAHQRSLVLLMGETEDILNTHRVQKTPASKSSRRDHSRQSFGSSLMMPFRMKGRRRRIDEFSILFRVSVRDKTWTETVTMTHHCNSTENFYLPFRFAMFQCSDDDALQFIDGWFLQRKRKKSGLMVSW